MELFNNEETCYTCDMITILSAVFVSYLFLKNPNNVLVVDLR